MKVLLINGSPRKEGNTATALAAVANQLAKEGIESGSRSYPASVYYIDIINEFERMGDFMINISQDLERVYAHR